MIKFYAGIIALALLCVTAEASDPTLDAVCGVWLNAKYIEALKATRSPVQAGKMEDPIVRIVNVDEGTNDAIFESAEIGSYAFRCLANCHDAWGFDLQGLEKGKVAGIYFPVFDGDDKHQRDNYRFIIKGNKPARFTWIQDQPKVVNGKKLVCEVQNQFVRMPGDHRQYINALIIAGKYTDDKGETYTFDQNGTAAWPNRPPFEYELYLDAVEPGFDFFKIKDARKNEFPRIFKWVDNKLLLYMYDNETNGPAPQPSLVLYPVTGESSGGKNTAKSRRLRK